MALYKTKAAFAFTDIQENINLRLTFVSLKTKHLSAISSPFHWLEYTSYPMELMFYGLEQKTYRGKLTHISRTIHNCFGNIKNKKKLTALNICQETCIFVV
ncbi:MAG TPA: hypothetical protein DCG33_02960 [Prevotellaceae bacterium]|nr:hypothetical protein [Prevotellaceae bacterium]